MAKQTFEMTFAGRPLVVEVGQVAKQANGAVVVRYGDTTVLSTAVMSKKMATADFFPLQVNYEEKMYAAGKFPGGFNKREGRPSTDATLTARLIDRPIRPMFAEGFRNEVQVINTVLSYDENASAPMAAMFGSSLALSSLIFLSMVRLLGFKWPMLQKISSSTQVQRIRKFHF